MKSIFSLALIAANLNRIGFFILTIIGLAAASLEALILVVMLPAINMLLDKKDILPELLEFLKLKLNLDGLQDILIISLGVLVVLSAALKIYNIYYSAKLQHEITVKISCSCIEKLLSKPFAELMETSANDKISLIGRTQVGSSMIFVFTNLVVSAITGLFLIISLCYINWGVMSIFTIIVVFVYLVYGLIARPILIRNSYRIAKIINTSRKCLHETFSATREIKIYDLGKNFAREYERKEAEWRLMDVKNSIISACPRQFVEAIVFIALFAYVTYLSNIGNIEIHVSEVAVLIFGIQRLVPAIHSVYQNNAAITSNTSSITDTVELWCYKGKKKLELTNYARKNLSIFENKLSIIIKEISFTYRNTDLPVISNLTMIMEPGRINAITGESGVGKSTLLDIMTGLLSVDTGRVYIDANDINKINIQEFWNNISYVSQNGYLFDESIKYNITLKQSNESDDEILELLGLVNLEEFIRKKQEGLDYVIGDNGGNLSAGQRQRLLLARAIYRKPRLIFLDEATSNLDKNNEEEIWRCLRKIAYKTTIVVVTHDSRNFKYFDKINKIQ